MIFKSFLTASFLGFPTWYQYLPKGADGSPKLTGLGDIWLIVAAAVEILLRVAALVAVFGVIYGGVLFVTSQGEPEKNAKARNALVYALSGLILAVVATALVTFIASSFKASS